jgi:hypothetical protein
MASLLVFSALFDVVEDVVNRFFGVVASYGASNIGEEFGVMFDSLDNIRRTQTAQQR